MSAATRQSVRGFSLVELLIVIGIIGLLTALLLPSLGRSRENARRLACAANMRGFGVASINYDLTYRQLPHTNNNSNVAHTFSVAVATVLTDDFGANTRFFACPSTINEGTGNWNASISRMSYHYFGGTAEYTGTNVNGWASTGTRWSGRNQGYFPQISISRPDSRRSWAMPIFMLDFAFRNYHVNAFGTLKTYYPKRSNHSGADHVGEGVNALFLDGHVAFQTLRPTVSWAIGTDAYYGFYWDPGDQPAAFPGAFIY